MDSTPIFKMRYRPKTTCPSAAETGGPSPSVNTAIFALPAPGSANPMTFSVIGGTGGGGGGPVGAGATGAASTGLVADGGGGGGAFGLNRNRLRSAGPGFGRSASSASRWTSGAEGVPGGFAAFAFVPDVPAVAGDAPLFWLDAAARVADRRGPACYTPPARPIATAGKPR